MSSAAGVLLFTRCLERGGAEWQLLLLARTLRERGLPVRVLMLYSEGPLVALLQKWEIPFLCLDKRGRWDFRFLIRFLGVLRGIHSGVIYAFLDVPILLSVLARPILRRTTVVAGIRATRLHRSHYDWFRRGVDALMPWMLKSADLVIANSHTACGQLVDAGVPRALLRVVPNGIDVQRFKADPVGRAALRAEWGISEGVPLIGVVARFDPMKDHATFLDAFAILLSTHPDAQAVLVGGGDPKLVSRVMARRDELGLAGVVAIVGARDDLSRVYSACDVVCLPSAYGEGFSNVLGEALSCGLACVATDVGDARLVLGEHGEIVAPGDVAELTAALARAIQQPPTDAAATRRREHIVTNFSVEAMVDGTLAALASISGRRR